MTTYSKSAVKVTYNANKTGVIDLGKQGFIYGVVRFADYGTTYSSYKIVAETNEFLEAMYLAQGLITPASMLNESAGAGTHGWHFFI